MINVKMKRKAIKLGTYVGKVIKQDGCTQAIRVRVQKMEMDKYLTMYFNKHYNYWAWDPEKQAKLGDLVMIDPLEEPKSTSIHHKLKEVVFQLGNVTDPVTGKKCRGPYFINEEDRHFNSLQNKIEAANISALKL